MEIRVYNTLTNKKEKLIPINPGKIGMYVCGVTVYDDCHIGHARGAIIFDMIRQYLEYRGFQVTYIHNFTDVDDKIINRAKKENCRACDVAEKYTAEYCRDMKNLEVKEATREPKATEHIGEIIDLIKMLQEKGFAYEVGGDVFFEINKFPEYGKLSNRDVDQMRAGARIDIDERKHDPLDFVLWKSAKEGEPFWESPWGPGRPGWHIECSAMSMKYLGHTFDIHGGGKDLIFPHHENEIAQSEAASGKPFARYWLHNGFVNINQEKMSKSLQNFFTIKEVLAQCSSEQLRLFLLSTHYRSPINFSLSAVEEAGKALARVYNTFYTVENIISVAKDGDQGESPESMEHLAGIVSTAEDMKFKKRINLLKADFEKAMDDDFNSAEAIGKLYDAVKEVNVFIHEHPQIKAAERNFLKNMMEKIKRLGSVLGIFQKSSNTSKEINSMGDFMEILLEVRNLCRSNKYWDVADLIRSRLQEKGITIEDRKEGTFWRKK